VTAAGVNGTIFVFSFSLIFGTMKDRNNTGEGRGRHEHPLRQEIDGREQKVTQEAHRQADEDMAEDPDLSAQSPNDDLDEGETARLGENETGLV
jgi:hypothetical protein